MLDTRVIDTTRQLCKIRVLDCLKYSLRYCEVSNALGRYTRNFKVGDIFLLQLKYCFFDYSYKYFFPLFSSYS